MNIRTIDHLEFYVEDAEKAATELSDLFGFAVRGYGGPETGLADHRSVLLRQRDITLLVTSPLHAGHPAVDYVREHRAGVSVVGFAVDDAAAAFAEAVRRGARPVAEPTVFEGGGDRVTFASVRGFGDVEHRFTSRIGSGGTFAPGAIDEIAGGGPVPGLLHSIDHLAVCLPAGTLDPTIEWYREVFDFEQTFEERIVVGRQAMNSKVVQSLSGLVTLTVIEPDTTRDPGQIDGFLKNHGSAGVQHIAFATDDIVRSVAAMRSAGVEFLDTPDAYYSRLRERLALSRYSAEELGRLRILADEDHAGQLFQIFTRSPHPRRTLFFEVIERAGATTFGSGNIRALYEAVEAEGV